MSINKALALVTLLLCSSAASASDISPLPAVSRITAVTKAAVPFDIGALKRTWRQRIEAIRATGVTPILDIESNLGEDLDIQEFARSMDQHGVALIAYSGMARGRGWSDAARYAVAADPWRYIPAGDGGLPPDWQGDPERFVELSRTHIVQDGYPLMGEYEFRHYPSPDQIRRGKWDRDETLALDGAAGHALFRLAEESGVSFQIHQEIEDQHLPQLEKMLTKFPKAKLICCHLAQMRYQARNTVYGVDFVRSLIERHPNLYFDLASGLPGHVYPLSHEHPGKYWDLTTGRLKPEWATLIATYPWRFMSAIDLNPFVMQNFSRRVGAQRAVLESLPPSVREIVAYKAAWKLLFNEEF